MYIFLEAVNPIEIDPIILIFALIFALALMVLSRVYNARIYSILSVGVWLFLAFEIANQLPLLIVCVGLIIYELYHAFISKS